ncbi:hypothetical protein N7509_004732 [Penicillium cosmopolitanum]|uniref:Uncharacterized protein n=1 Tax=Penicillium cosmopolitanum TaxID=1131564 RepID=A0A9X0B9F8_9EURO|nr:uncharacterized protein N7509_004732 [Penicillium cosmopolitanum]KAJ5396619.1 hypothetical protein N7509_004732 [Penicillium cosmopolitanum]
MMECASHRLSHATLRLRVFRQLYISNTGPRFLNRSISTSSAQLSQAHHEAPSPTPPSPSSSTKDYIPPSKRLPQSPVITHPRSGFKKIHKPRPKPEDNAELKKNPWAAALASPVRFCVTTGTRLPRRLMGVYGLIKRPNTNHNYLLPLDLLKDSIQNRSAKSEGESLTSESKTNADANVASGGDVSPSISRGSTFNHSLHMVTLRPLIQAATPHLASRMGKRAGVAKLIPYRWKIPIGPLGANDLRDCVWRDDMPDYLLRLMREDIVKRLVNFSERLEEDRDIVWEALDIDEYSDSALETALGNTEPLEYEACGAVLLFAPKPQHEAESGSASKTVVHPRTQSTIPVFDLSVLLSENVLETLRTSSCAHLESEALFFRPNGGREDNSLMLYLWKLQRYLAENS